MDPRRPFASAVVAGTTTGQGCQRSCARVLTGHGKHGSSRRRTGLNIRQDLSDRERSSGSMKASLHRTREPRHNPLTQELVAPAWPGLGRPGVSTTWRELPRACKRRCRSEHRRRVSSRMNARVFEGSASGTSACCELDRFPPLQPAARGSGYTEGTGSIPADSARVARASRRGSSPDEGPLRQEGRSESSPRQLVPTSRMTMTSHDQPHGTMISHSGEGAATRQLRL